MSWSTVRFDSIPIKRGIDAILWLNSICLSTSEFSFFPSLCSCCENTLPVCIFINSSRSNECSSVHIFQTNRCQFHQHYKHTFFVRTSFWCLFLVTCTLPKQHSYEKFVRLMLMKLTSGRHVKY